MSWMTVDAFQATEFIVSLRSHLEHSLLCDVSRRLAAISHTASSVDELRFRGVSIESRPDDTRESGHLDRWVGPVVVMPALGEHATAQLSYFDGFTLDVAERRAQLSRPARRIVASRAHAMAHE